MPAKLSVNLNAIAMLRNRRDLPWPSVTGLGRIALAAGAHGLTVHPRPDQRHTRYSDLPELRALIDDEFPAAEFNIEGYPDRGFSAACGREPAESGDARARRSGPGDLRPWLEFRGDAQFLTPIVRRLKKGGFRVSLFSDPDPEGVGCGARHRRRPDRTLHGPLWLQPFQSGTRPPASWKGLGKPPMRPLPPGSASMPATISPSPTCRRWRRIPRLAEVSIGHGLTADALEYGMAGTIGRFLKACGW